MRSLCRHGVHRYNFLFLFFNECRPQLVNISRNHVTDLLVSPNEEHFMLLYVSLELQIFERTF